jgi:hypothetical protein
MFISPSKSRRHDKKWELSSLAVLGVILLLYGNFINAALATDISARESAIAAAQRLSVASNYAWQATIRPPHISNAVQRTMNGRTEKSGYTLITDSIGSEVVARVAWKGTNIVGHNSEGRWIPYFFPYRLTPHRSPPINVTDFPMVAIPDYSGLDSVSLDMAPIKTPAVDIAQLLGEALEVKNEVDGFSGDLTGAAVFALLTGEGVGEISGEKAGRLRIWVLDGCVVKYEYSAKVILASGGVRQASAQIVIKDIGTTKVEVPEEALKLLEPPNR